MGLMSPTTYPPDFENWVMPSYKWPSFTWPRWPIVQKEVVKVREQEMDPPLPLPHPTPLDLLLPPTLLAALDQILKSPPPSSLSAR